MKTLSVLVCLLASASAQTLLRCNANNCLRAVRATDKPERSASASCSSFLRHTLTTTSTSTTTLYTSTATITATTSITYTTTISLVDTTAKKRDALETPTNIPSYASACEGAVGYSSACSCIGVIGTTVTVADPSTTKTATKFEYTTTATETISTKTETIAVVTATALAIQIQNPNNFPGQYLKWAPVEGADGLKWTPNSSEASKFILQPDGRITSPNGDGEKYLVAYGGSETNTEAHFVFSTVIYAPVSDAMVCTLNANHDISFAHPTTGTIRLGSYSNDFCVIWARPGVNFVSYAGVEFQLRAVQYFGSE